jgi:hypothetical protein
MGCHTEAVQGTEIGRTAPMQTNTKLVDESLQQIRCGSCGLARSAKQWESN